MSKTFKERLMDGVHLYGDWGESDTWFLVEKACRLNKEEVSELERAVTDMAEWQFALMEQKPMPNGEYAHFGICSGNRKAPLGQPGCVCDHRGREWRAQIQRLTEEGQKQKKKIDRQRSHLRTLNKAMRERRWQERSRRYSTLLKVAEELTWAAGQERKSAPGYTWTRMETGEFCDLAAAKREIAKLSADLDAAKRQISTMFQQDIDAAEKARAAQSTCRAHIEDPQHGHAMECRKPLPCPDHGEGNT